MATEPSDQHPSGTASGNGESTFSADQAADGSASGKPFADPELPNAGFTWTEGGVILGAFVLITAIMIASLFTGPPCCSPDTSREAFIASFNRAGYYFLLALTTIPVFWACVRLRPRNIGWGPTLAGHASLALVAAFGLQMGREFLVYGLVQYWPPADGGCPSLPSVTGELANLAFLDELVPYLALLAVGLVREGYLRGRARRERAEQLQREAEQLRSQLTEARLQSLRMQINPHFFHNTLHTISTMAGRDPDGIRRATARLSDLMRHVLSTSDQQEIALDEELDVLESYLEIQKLRLDERLDVTMDIEPVARTALVPTLLLQPLAENAVKHGFEGRDETGHLEIRARREEDTLVLEVCDNGNGMPDDGGITGHNGETSDLRTGDGSLGLENIAERLDRLYGDAASLEFDESEEGGLCVVVRIPFRASEPSSDFRTSGVVAD